MKKIYLILSIVLVSLVIIVSAVMGLLTWQKSNTDNQLKKEKQQVSNYLNYQFSDGEFNKLKRSEKNDIYYYAANGKRYVFPDDATYKSWFPTILPNDIMLYSLDKLYETPLGGNVTLRPGSLMQTPTDPNVYLVIKNGQINAVSDPKLLTKLYGENWQKLIITIPNFYFTNYKVIKPINSLADFPDIPSQITIDQDKGLK